MTTTDTAPEAEALAVVLPVVSTIVVKTTEGPVECRVKRLKTREILILLRVLTTAFGTGAVSQLKLNQESPEAMAADAAALMMVALPEAGTEFVHFVSHVVEPIDEDKAEAVYTELVNPEADVILDAFEVIAVQEKDNLFELMGKVKSLWARISDLYATQKPNKAKKGASPRR